MVIISAMMEFIEIIDTQSSGICWIHQTGDSTNIPAILDNCRYATFALEIN